MSLSAVRDTVQRRAQVPPSPLEVVIISRHPRSIRPVRLAARAVLALAIALPVLGIVPRPVMAEVPVARADELAVPAAPDGARERTGLEPFDLIGATWSGPGTLEVRVHDDDGGWSGWEDLERAPEEGPDPVTGEPAPAASEPLWVDGADGFTIRHQGKVADVVVHLVRSGTERRPVASTDDVAGATPPPVARGFTIHTRSEWAARPPKDTPSYSPIKAAVIHHTVNSNAYSPDDVPGILRAIQAYHMDANGWDDIAYNFLVDRFGRAWEGRGGGIDQPVIGGHTLGFNTGTVGISAIGDFTSQEPTAAMVDTITHLVGWKLAISGVDPTATTVLTNRAPNHPRYADGQQVRLPTVFAHRDTSPTGCPGTRLYARVGGIRDEAVRRYPYVLGTLDTTSFAAGGVRVRGWTLARGTTSPLSVHVIVDGVYAAADGAHRSRPDVGAAFPTYGDDHGYDLVAPAGPGPHTVCVFGITNTDGRNQLLGCQPTVVPTDPFGSLDGAARAPGAVSARGWALDPNTAGPVPVDFYVNGAMVGRALASGFRPDVGAAYYSYGSDHGYDVRLPAPPTDGPAEVCAYAINVAPGSANTALGCRSVQVGHNPFGSLDSVTANRIRGWAIDPDVVGAINVDLYVNGGWGGRHVASASRPDVGAAYPAWGASHGYDILLGSIPPPGSTVCAYAINTGPGSTNPPLGCLRT